MGRTTLWAIALAGMAILGTALAEDDSRPKAPHEEAEAIIDEQVRNARAERMQGVDEIRSRGPEARQVIEALLLAGLDDPNPEFGFELDGLAAEPVPVLRLIVREGKGHARTAAVDALRRLGRDAAISLPLLIEILGNPKEDVKLREAAIEAAAAIGEPHELVTAALAKMLAEPDRWLASTAADALCQMGKRATSVADAVADAAIKHPDAYARQRCLLALCTVLPDRAGRARILAAALSDHGTTGGFEPSVPVSMRALEYLTELGSDAAPAVPELLAMLKDDDTRAHQRTYRNVTIALANCGEVARDAVNILRQDLRLRPEAPRPAADPILGVPGPFQPDPGHVPYLRACAARALIQLMPDDAEAFAVLKTTLTDPNLPMPRAEGPFGRSPDPREEAAVGLGYCVQERDQAVALLTKTLATADDLVLRWACTWSLARLGALDKQQAPNLNRYDGWTNGTLTPTEYVALIGSHADLCVPEMLSLALSYSPTLVEFSFEALLRLKKETALAQDAARAILAGENVAGAEYALVRLGDKSAPAVPPLVAALTAEDWRTRARAASALGKIKLQPQTVIPALAGRIADEHALVRARAIEAVGEFGPAARPHARAIEAALTDRHLTVRLAATFATRSIRGDAAPRRLPAADDPVFRDDISARLDMKRFQQRGEHQRDWETCLQELSQPKTDRRAIHERMKGLLAVEPALNSRVNRRLVDTLNTTLIPSGAKPGSVDALIDAWIDLDEKPHESPDSYDLDPRVLAVVRLGFKAVPALIDHWNDVRLTRIRQSREMVHGSPLGFTTVGEAAQTALWALSGESFDDVESASRWWQKASEAGEARFVRSAILSRLEKGEDIGRGQEYWIGQQHGRLLIPVYEAWLKRPVAEKGWQLARTVGRSALPKEEKIALFRRGAAQDDFETRWQALAQLVHIDEDALVELAVPQIGKLPLKARSRDDLNCVFTTTRALSDSTNPKLWEAILQHVQRADVVLRMEYINPINWYGTAPRSLPQRLAFAAAFLDDDAERVVGHKPAVQAAPSFRRLEVRNLAAWNLANMLEMDVEPHERWTAEQWANLREQVRQKLRTRESGK